MTSLSLLEIAVLHINCLCHTVFLKCGWNALTIGCNHLRSQILNKYFPWEDICDLLVYNEKLDLNSFHPYTHTCIEVNTAILFISCQSHFNSSDC